MTTMEVANVPRDELRMRQHLSMEFRDGGSVTFGMIPDEIIIRILYYLPPEENIGSFQLVSRRYSRLANEPLLWRYHCRTSFKHWDASHEIHRKLALPVSYVDWKQLWLQRWRDNARVSALLDGILATKVGRLKKFEELCLLGYDAKDFLLEQCNTPESAEDVLARRYYAGAALGSIHRGVAIREWANFQSPNGSLRLDRALAGFDMFVLHDQAGDIDDVQALLDRFALDFLAAHPHFKELSTRRKALALLAWVRSQNLTGMDNPQANYRNIRNCLIGHALLDERHPSLPLISSAIYCCLAERVGMRAACCAFPAHVHVCVFAPAEKTLDGAPVEEPSGDLEMMYLDPYSSDREIHIQELRMKLDEYGGGSWDGTGREAWLKASPTSVLVIRTAHNIRASYVRFQQTRSDDHEATNFALPGGDPSINMESLLYAVLWVSLMLTPTAHQLWDSSLEHFLNRFRKYFVEDAWLLRKYLAPLYDQFIFINARQANVAHRPGWEDVHLALQLEQSLDTRPPTVRRRDTWATRHRLRYHVGQVFEHRRYGTHGIITGWNAEGAGTNRGIRAGDDSGSDSASGQDGGRPGGTRTGKDIYYTCMRTDVDKLLVAEDNMEIITDPDRVPASLMRAAGKFFKRFDRKTCTFVSNVKEMFPDD